MNESLIKKLESAILAWIDKPLTSGLDTAIQMTVIKRLFSSNDVHFAVNQLRNRVVAGDLRDWCNRHNEKYESYRKPETVLCLHAGNLPLVGFQDAMAVILSGNKYAGKISRKDPYLLPSFLDYFITRNPEYSEIIIYNTDIHTFFGLKADKWMFAGSENSLSEINSKLSSSMALKRDAKSLLRTAHFSVAVCLGTLTEVEIGNLVEAILRYGGKGCRSVAIIYSDLSLNEIASKLSVQGANWLKEKGIEFRPSELLKLKYAYNAAVNIDQVWVGNALIQQGIPAIGHPQHVFWQPIEKLSEQVVGFGSGIQQIYMLNESNSRFMELKTDNHDYLVNSQRPHLYWKPDGVDPLEWILTH
jgi:hypothetical protein